MEAMTQILTNHIGYDTASTKTAVLQLAPGAEERRPLHFELRDYAGNVPVLEGNPEYRGAVDRWKTGVYYVLRFDSFREEGKYYLAAVMEDGEEIRSFPFEIARNLLELRTLSSVVYYFKMQRSTGEYEAIERDMPIELPRSGRFDVHGGWWDATGDLGVHLAERPRAVYSAHQQSSLVAYSLFKAHDLLEESRNPEYVILKRRILDEAMYGADFLMRMRAPEGGFFLSKSRGNEPFTPVMTSRYINSSRYGKFLPGGTGGAEDYGCSFRCGGGYAIAALAYAARTQYPSDYHQEEYLAAAVEAYDYLAQNNTRYTVDGKWNLLDEYCALEALVELYKTTREYDYLRRAREIAARMAEKYIPLGETMGYLAYEDGTDLPYFNVTEAGAPVVSLLHYAEIEMDDALRDQTVGLTEKLLRHELAVTEEVANPFGYARQRVFHPDRRVETLFFYPHDTEVAPWWLGESARQGSLAAAMRMMMTHTKDTALAADCEQYADDQLNWILGLNPFDSSMMHGHGRNNPYYFFQGRFDFPQTPGGIANGITSASNDEHGIEYVTAPTPEIDDNYRWAEQWVPHDAWYLLALAAKRI